MIKTEMFKNFKKRIIQYSVSSIHLLVFLIPFSVYLYTLCPTISVYADAGEYSTMAFVSGFGHPPGYPLFILILKLFQLLPFGNPAYKANLAAAFLASIALILFYQLLKNLLKNRWLAFISAMILAFSKIFWKNAIVSEVFGLTALFIVLIFFLFQLWSTTKQKKFFYWLMVVLGFGLAHHQAVILVSSLPFIVWFLVAKMWRELKIKDYLLFLPLLAIGYLPYLYVFIVAHKIPLMNWDNPQTLTGLYRLITRASYGSFTLTNLPEKVSFSIQSLGLMKLWLSSFSVLGILLTLLGLFKTFKVKKQIFFYSLFIILVVGFFLSYYSGMPFNELYQIQYLERFQIITSIFFTILAGFGLLQINQWLHKIKTNSLRIFLASIIVIVPLFILITNFKKVNQRGNYFGEYLAQDILSNTPQDSLLIFGNDATINVLLYERYVLGQRKDVTFLIDGFLMANPSWWHQEIKKHYPEIIFPLFQSENPEQYLIDFLDFNSEKRPIVFIENDSLPRYGINLLDDPEHFQFIGLTQIYLPPGAAFKTQSEEEKEVLSYYDKYQNLKVKRTYPDDWAESALIDIYTFPLISLAEVNPQRAEEFYQKAIDINPEYAYALTKLGEIYQNKGETAKAKELWQKALKTGRADTTLKKEIKDNLLWEKF